MSLPFARKIQVKDPLLSDDFKGQGPKNNVISEENEAFKIFFLCRV